MQTLEQKLDRIEHDVAILQRRLRRSRRFAFFAILAAGIAIAGGANFQLNGDAKESISTRRLVITDPAGTPRIVLEAAGENAAQSAPTALIKLLDADGKATHSIVQFRDGAGYWAHRFGTDKEWVQMSSSPGHAGISMASRTFADEKKRRASFNVSERGHFTISADNEHSSKEHMWLSLANDLPEIGLSDASGKTLVINAEGVSQQGDDP